MIDPGAEIAGAFGAIQCDARAEEARERYRKALAAVKADPPATDPAWDEYDAAVEALAVFREDAG